MTKSICALAHKPGSTRDDFQAYYEDHHVPLAISHFPFTAYTRNHVSGAQAFGWDTISEFWADDIEAAAALDGQQDVNLRTAVLNWARTLADDMRGVSVDFTTNWSVRAFPAKAVLWLPGTQNPAIPQRLSVQRLELRHAETPASKLLGFGSSSL